MRADCRQRRALLEWADDLTLRLMAEQYEHHPDFQIAISGMNDHD